MAEGHNLIVINYLSNNIIMFAGGLRKNYGLIVFIIDFKLFWQTIRCPGFPFFTMLLLDLVNDS